MDHQGSRERLRRRAANRLWTISALLPHNRWRHDEYCRVYLYHVRKTAGTSIAFAFMRLAGSDPHRIEHKLSRFAFAQSNGYRYVANNAALISGGSYFFAYSHEPAYQVNPPTVGTFKLTILRDPIDRVVSLYRYLARPEADLTFSLVAPLEERRWAMEGFDRFLDQIPRRHLANQLYMFSESLSVDEAVDHLNRLDMVLRTEQLDRGLRYLESILNLQLSVGRERSSRLSFTPTDTQRNRLYDLLKPEFEMLRQIDADSKTSYALR
jgi:Sulfotransferase family